MDTGIKMKDIKLLCQERGLKLKDVAEAVGMTSQNLGVAMRGNPTLSLLRRVANALGITMQELFAADDMWINDIDDKDIVGQTTVMKREGIAFVQLKLSLGDYQGAVVERRNHIRSELEYLARCVEMSIGELDPYGEYEIDVRICEKR